MYSGPKKNNKLLYNKQKSNHLRKDNKEHQNMVKYIGYNNSINRKSNHVFIDEDAKKRKEELNIQKGRSKVELQNERSKLELQLNNSTLHKNQEVIIWISNGLSNDFINRYAYELYIENVKRIGSQGKLIILCIDPPNNT